MLSTQTLEVRWFEQGIPPAEVKDWFSADCPGEQLDFPETREDLYLYVPQGEAYSLKLRQEHLELKWRKAELGTQQFDTISSASENPHSWQGNLERWVKWTYKDSAPPNIISEAAQEQRLWTIVKKVRWQRLYQNVTCELAQLEVRACYWWSIAFEMVEEKSNQREHFEQTVTQVSQTYPGPLLLVEKSYAYPSWLSRIGMKSEVGSRKSEKPITNNK